MNYKDVLEKIRSLSEDKYRSFMNSLVPGNDKILGVRLPALRTLAKQIAKEDVKTYLDETEERNKEDMYFEEIMLQGFVIGYMKSDIEERFAHLRLFIPRIDNWAVNDSVSATLKVCRKHPEETWEFLQPYLKSKQEFEVRFVLIMLMDYFLNDKYIDCILDICNEVKHEGYYVKMANAWLIATAYAYFPEKTHRFMENNTLDDFTYNKAIQKMIESNRITGETKAVLRGMKRK